MHTHTKTEHHHSCKLNTWDVQGCVDALFDYGRLLEEVREDALSAERMYRRALQVNSCHVPALSNLGLLLEETRGDDVGAEDMYRRWVCACVCVCMYVYIYI